MPIQLIFGGAARALGLGRSAVSSGMSQLRGEARRAALTDAQAQLRAIQKSLKSIQIKSDFPSLERELRTSYGTSARGRSEIAKATTRGMNSGIRPAKTVSKRKISDKRNLPAKRVDAGLELQFATTENQTVAIRARGRMIPLTQLKGGLSNPKQLSKGVKVSATRGKRTLIEGAFIARGKRGMQVFQRAKIGGGPKRHKRLPIQALTVPSIPHTLLLDEVREPTIERFNGAWSNAYEKQLSASIRRANARIKG